MGAISQGWAELQTGGGRGSGSGSEVKWECRDYEYRDHREPSKGKARTLEGELSWKWEVTSAKKLENRQGTQRGGALGLWSLGLTSPRQARPANLNFAHLLPSKPQVLSPQHAPKAASGRSASGLAPAGAQQHQTSALRARLDHNVAPKSTSSSSSPHPIPKLHPQASSTNGAFPKITLPGLFPSNPAVVFARKPPRLLHLAPGSLSSSSLARLRGTALPAQQEHGSLNGAVCSPLQLPILHPPLLSRPLPRRAGQGMGHRAERKRDMWPMPLPETQHLKLNPG